MPARRVELIYLGTCHDVESTSITTEQALGRVDLPGLSRSQDPELLRRNAGAGDRFRKREPRRVDRLVGQLKCSVMVRQRKLSAAVAERLHSFVGVHVLIAHEPA